ncbi:MAG: tetratricopeptide repeat protein [Oscillochloris sp.]|nr:tetratricopeptide repeat protein [Oscillochloris sp.]
MPANDLIGTEHNAHLDWLLNNWMIGDSPVCFLQGFPGTGKTTIARALLSRAIAAKTPAVIITVPETTKDPTDDLLLDLAMELNSAGKTELAQAIDNNRPLLEVLSSIVNDPILIIIDEFQNAMQGPGGVTVGGFAKVLSTLANRKWLKGRILLLTNRLVEEDRLTEPYAIRTLNGMSTDDGVELLEYFAHKGGRIDEITPERRRDVVKWLGGNPRAIQLLVRSLAYESLDDLIGIQPELWEMRDREVSVELIEKLERGLLERTLSQISDEYMRQLQRLGVYRKPFERPAIERLFNTNGAYARFRNEMIDRFLMEHHKGWFNLHPIVREIGRQKLAQSPGDLRQAHSTTARYYTRHFEAKQIVGWGALGGHFVEARYHLVKAERADDLKDIAFRFQNYIFSALSSSSTIPRSAEELDERIAVLSALLETPGPTNLEYHLARLFKVRNQRNDLRRALHHANRAKANSDYAPTWLLCSELLSRMGRVEEAIDVLKAGIARIPVDRDVKALYASCAQILAQQGRHQEAVDLLEHGIARVPVDHDVKALYASCAQILTQQGAPRRRSSC